VNTMTSTFEHLAALLAQDYKLHPARLTPDATLAALGLDSLGTAEVLWHVEGLFNIELRPDPAGLATLGELARCVDEQVAAQRGRSIRGAHRPLPLPDRPDPLFDAAQTQRRNATSLGANASPNKR